MSKTHSLISGNFAFTTILIKFLAPVLEVMGFGFAIAVVPITVLMPAAYPVRDVVCVIVAQISAGNPITLDTLITPLIDAIATDPVETVGLAQM